MQFYLNGYTTGDPFVEDPHPSVENRRKGMPAEADVVIIGCGPAGLVLAAQMANFPELTPSMITAEPVYQHLAEGFAVGMRFHSAPVVRLADAKPIQLGHVARADGAWRIYIFADRNDPTGEHWQFRQLCEFLESDASPINRFTPTGADPDSVIDVRAIFQQSHHELSIDELPPVVLPRKGKFGLIDYEKMFCPDPTAGDIFDLRGVLRETGCMVVVRPDQYVAHVLPLNACDALADFFAEILFDVGAADQPP